MAMKRIIYNGRLVNERTAAMIERAEGLLGYKFTITQGSYNRSVGASAGTHDGGGAVDISINGIDPDEVVWALRKVGFAAWYRPAIRGLWPAHIHAIAIGDPELSPVARRQVAAYYAGRDGLANNGPDNGPRIRPIPVWPIRKTKISLAVAERQFKKDDPQPKRAVKIIQRLLNVRYGENLVIDGVAGPMTREAYKRYQAAIDPKYVTGIPGPRSLKKLVAGHHYVV